MKEKTLKILLGMLCSGVCNAGASVFDTAGTDIPTSKPSAAQEELTPDQAVAKLLQTLPQDLVLAKLLQILPPDQIFAKLLQILPPDQAAAILL
jgi:hypothetical protein